MKNGFTLIETFVAITILVFAVLGPMALLSRTISDGNYAKNQITAFYLAEEAIEYVINNRDSLFIEAKKMDDTPGDSWYQFRNEDGLPTDVCVGNWCSVDTINQAVAPCTIDTNNDDCSLYQDKNNNRNGLYVHGTGNTMGLNQGMDKTLFKRVVKIEPIEDSGGAEVRITAQVAWKNKEAPKTIDMVTYMFQQHYDQ